LYQIVCVFFNNNQLWEPLTLHSSSISISWQFGLPFMVTYSLVHPVASSCLELNSAGWLWRTQTKNGHQFNWFSYC